MHIIARLIPDSRGRALNLSFCFLGHCDGIQNFPYRIGCPCWINWEHGRRADAPFGPGSVFLRTMTEVILTEIDCNAIMFGWRPSAEDGHPANYSVVRLPGPHLTGDWSATSAHPARTSRSNCISPYPCAFSISRAVIKIFSQMANDFLKTFTYLCDWKCYYVRSIYINYKIVWDQNINIVSSIFLLSWMRIKRSSITP